MKQPEEAEQKDDPKYCKYHHGHAIQDCFVLKKNVMQLARQSKISLEKDFETTNAIIVESGYFDGNKDSCNIAQGDDTTSNGDTLLVKEDSSNVDDCMSRITLTDEDLFLGSKPHNRPLFVTGYVYEQKCFKYCYNGIVKKVLGDRGPYTQAESHFADAKYYIGDDKKGKEVWPAEEPKSYNSQSIRKNDQSTIETEISKGLPLTQIKLKQPSKPTLKGFVPST
ncbi:hypothetical protein Sango_1890000 [Sesamum angolense]|uniref:Uncharacterized protein n=1 Tax=Sesamum angolense TaxID=2727404 RepID=A0AAE1WIV8_9LAMI|nr:hypothetical protein Sango_1890000 [Sesamum angolense]